MAATSGTSGSVAQTAVFKISHADFQETTGNADQTVSLLVPSSAITTRYLIKGVAVMVTEAWTSTAPAIQIGDNSDQDGFNTTTSGASLGTKKADAGAYLKTSAYTHTAVGSNTGTSNPYLSAIGNTSSVDQSAALMNDLLALQEDIEGLESLLSDTSIFGHLADYTSGNGVKATVTLGSGNFSDKTAGEFLVVIEYIDLSAL